MCGSERRYGTQVTNRGPGESASEGEPVSRERVVTALRHLADSLAPDDIGVRRLPGQLEL